MPVVLPPARSFARTPDDDREDGRLVVFADEGRRVFARRGRPPVDLVPITLDENLRNTKEIAQTFGSLVPTQQRIRGASGVPVRLVPRAADAAPAAAGDVVEALLEHEGWSSEHVAQLATGRRHPVQVEGQDEGHAAYWRHGLAAEATFYGHVLGFEGLERPVVVLAVNGVGRGDGAGRSRERLDATPREALDREVQPERAAQVGGQRRRHPPGRRPTGATPGEPSPAPARG